MNELNLLNEQQKKAVLKTEGPLLILAGAGSGKTRVLTHRVAYLIKECNVAPWNILAITFTNKAAGEMRERVDKIAGKGADEVWVSTFHSLCVRILRRFIDRIGYERNFSIYDSDDSKTVMKNVCKRLNIDTKLYKEKYFLNQISKAKDELITVMQFERNAAESDDHVLQIQARVYREYQQELKNSNALDFDDLIMKTAELLNSNEDVLDYYQERFRYIMVDEYQDTNTAQFKLVSTLASRYHNLCVVGDDDQSIYKFRGANIRNILDFEKTYPEAEVIKLEENYRSTSNILDAANGVIKNNTGRKSKSLWTEKDKGSKVYFRQFNNEYEEANGIVDDIKSMSRGKGSSYNDFAILYRTNAQSRILEEKLVFAGIPYKIIGGQNFYARKEIKDILAYLKLLDNDMDDLAFKRVINVPKRGIGNVTIEKIAAVAFDNDMPMFRAACDENLVSIAGKAGNKLFDFTTMIRRFRIDLETETLSDTVKKLIDTIGYVRELEAEHSEEADGRIGNIEELINKIMDHEKNHEETTLQEFLAEVSLVADIDNLNENEDRVVLMTLHSAKGLEFKNVYMAGMEDGLFPSYMSIIGDDPDEVEEERRLCYVGITRAEERLMLTWARTRMVRGSTQYNKVSRFVKEIPLSLLDMEGVFEKDRGFERENRGYLYDDMSIGFGKKNSGTSFNTGFSGHNNPYAPGSNSRSSKPSLFNMPGIKKGIDLKSTAPASYNIGDKVSHIKYGKGIVTELTGSGNEAAITVDFEKFGTKVMRLAFTKLKLL